jgi:signal peptidase
MALEMTTSPTTPPSGSERAVTPEPSRAGVAVRVVGWLLMILAGLVVLGLLAVTVGPRFLPYQALVVRSGSMSPGIPTGSIVFYRKTTAAKVKAGDIIVFAKPGDAQERVTHRVVQVKTGPAGRYFVTKGDANGTPDDWRVPAVGTGWVASFHVARAGYALVYMRSTFARLLLLVFPAILLGAITLYEIWQDRARGEAA